VFDHASPIGELIVAAPTYYRIEARFHGTAAHAGIRPEDGRNAIVAAASALAALRLGRIDGGTTANVGRIEGGTARNIMPEWCAITAEARSHDDRKLADVVQEMLDAFAFAASTEECEVETEVETSYRGYRFRRDDQAVSLAARALSAAGYVPTYALSGGGADANVFNERGLSCVNLANGMAQIHTPDEHIAVADLEGMVEVTLALVDAARSSHPERLGAA
jgi:tripeptide aminopeptidase